MADNAEATVKRSLLAELRRRNVFRAAAIYIAAAWALAQGIAQLAPAFNAPVWTTRWFVIACAIGFPFWVTLAWLFKITPGGLKRESVAETSDPAGKHPGRKLDFWIIGVMAVAIVLLLTNTLVLHDNANSTTSAADAKIIAAQLTQVPFESVAVLPFTSANGDPGQQYLSEGLSEELISDLTQIHGLKVIRKESSFKFRHGKDAPSKIGVALRVAHLIDGSVGQQGDRIRITIHMISTKDGRTVWSHSYDAQLNDIFKIQAKITEAVVEALQMSLPASGIVARHKPPGGNVQAYELMLQGQAIYRHGTEASIRQSIALFRHALQLDSTYAYVWGLVSNASINLGRAFLTGGARQNAYDQARVAAGKEQLLAPNSAQTYDDRGYLLDVVDSDSVGALAKYKRALTLAPNDTTSMTFVAGELENTGHLQAAEDLFRRVLVIDPLRVDVYDNLAVALLGQRKLDAAEWVTRKALALQPDYPWLYATLTEIDVLRGNAKAALGDAAKEADPVDGPWARVLAQQVDPHRRTANTALRNYIAKQGKTHPYLVADLYAWRNQPNEMFEWLQRALSAHDSYFSASLLTDPFVLAYQHDPRFAALCRKAGLPAPSQPPRTVVRSHQK